MNQNKKELSDDLELDTLQNEEAFNVETKKSFFSFLKKDKTPAFVPPPKIRRVNAAANEGLNTKQVNERIQKGYVNSAVKKYSKTYRSIFIGNICTFFNLLCLIAALALLIAKADLSQFTFVLIFLCNIVIGIVQEIRAKLKIEKLAILSSPYA